MDFISSLPEDIREKILTYLPIKEAGRTSVLSRTWKCTWTSIPELKIRDSDSCYVSLSSPSIKQMVETILLRHSGPILKFDLKTRERCSDAFDRWISNLSRNEIKELKLDFNYSSRYKIHSSLFSCDTLTSLSLVRCSVKLPVGFKGFKFLHTLDIQSVDISNDCLKQLVLRSPVLENLKLCRCGTCTILNIQAPNLKHLDIDGKFMAFYLNAPNLLTLSVDLHGLLVETESRKISLEQVFGGPNLEMLALGSYFIESLAKLHDIWKFPMIFQNLKMLYINLKIEDERVFSFVLSLFQSTPNLQILDIEMYSNWNDHRESESPIPNFWESVNGKDMSLNRLRFVNIYSFDDIENVIAFAKFSLGCTPELLELTIDNASYFDNDDLGAEAAMCLKRLLKLRRASAKAQIIIK